MSSSSGPAIELEPGRVATPRYVDDELLGFAITHPCSLEQHRDEGAWIPTHADVGDRGWKVVQLEPLTLAPSLACRICGDHGSVRDGRWVPA